MYALAVMMSRSEDAVQTWNQTPVLRKMGDDVPCERSWKSSCQSCKGVGKGDRTGVGSTCPSPTSQFRVFDPSE
jgi:Neuraminidase (sialidase)